MGWVRTTICPAYEGSVRISPQPVDAVVNTSSPSAARSVPWIDPVRTVPSAIASNPGDGNDAGRPWSSVGATGVVGFASACARVDIGLLPGITVPALKDSPGSLPHQAVPPSPAVVGGDAALGTRRLTSSTARIEASTIAESTSRIGSQT